MTLMTSHEPIAAPAPPPAESAAVGSGWARPHRIFPLLALLFGLPLVLLTAPFQAPDEPAHFFRAYQISEGHLLPVYRDHHGGGELPESLEEVADRFERVKFHPAEKVSWAEVRQVARVPLEARRRKFTEFVSAIYSPASYIPQSIAIGLGRQLGLGPLALMYAGRVGNLLFWVALSYLALRVTPACGRPFLLLLMMPMTLFQAASLSADPITNGLAMLFTAMVLRNVRGIGGTTVVSASSRPPPTRNAPAAGGPTEPAGGPDAALPRISLGGYAAFAVVAVLLALTKFAYLTLLALVFLIPAARFGGWVRYLAAVALLGVLGLAASMAWTSQTQGLDTVVRQRPGVSPAGQVRYLREHPSMLWTVTAATVSRNGSAIVRSFVGRLGWLDTPMSYLFTDAYLIALFAACWLEERPWRFPPGWLLPIILVPVALSTFAIALLNYLYTMPVGWKLIGGVQGRYLIPLAPAVFVLLWGLTRRLPRHATARAAGAVDFGTVLAACFAGVYTLLVVWIRYHGTPGL